MPHLIFTPRALQDIKRLSDFLAEKSPEAAQRAVERILESVNILERHPAAGRPVRELGPSFREWPIRFASTGYVALYRHAGDQVMVLGIRSFREETQWTPATDKLDSDE